MAWLRLNRVAIRDMENRFERVGEADYLRLRPGGAGFRLLPGERATLRADWYRRTAFARRFLPYAFFGGLPTLLLIGWATAALLPGFKATKNPAFSALVFFIIIGLPLLGLAVHAFAIRRANRLMAAEVENRAPVPDPGLAWRPPWTWFDYAGLALLLAVVAMDFYYLADPWAKLGRGPMGPVSHGLHALAALWLLGSAARRWRRARRPRPPREAVVA